MAESKSERVLDFSAEEYTYMALGYYQNGNLKKAMENIDNASYIFDEDPPFYKDKKELALCMQMRANVLSKWGEEKQSLKAFRKAKKLQLKQDDKIGYADCLVDEGTARDDFGQPRKALRLRKKAIRELEKLTGTEKELARAYYFMGDTYHKSRKINKAEACYQKSVELGETAESLYFALGFIKLEKRDYHAAVTYFLTSAEKREKTYADMPYNMKLCEIYTLIGDVYTLMDLHVKAVKYYVRALKVAEASYRYLPHDELKPLYQKLAFTYEKLSEPSRAEYYNGMAEAL